MGMNLWGESPLWIKSASDLAPNRPTNDNHELKANADSCGTVQRKSGNISDRLMDQFAPSSMNRPVRIRMLWWCGCWRFLTSGHPIYASVAPILVAAFVKIIAITISATIRSCISNFVNGLIPAITI